MKKTLSVLLIVLFAVIGFTVSASAETLPATVVKAETVSSTRIKLNWNKVDGAEKYAVYISKPNTPSSRVSSYFGYYPTKNYNGAFKLLVKTTELKYTAMNLDDSSKYNFYVVPLDISKNGKTTNGKHSAIVFGTTGGYYKTGTYDSNGNEMSCSNNSEPLYVYDSKGNMLTYESKRNMITDTYYQNNNLFSKTFYTYDSKGNRLTATLDSGSKWLYTYNSKGNMLTETYYNSDSDKKPGRTSYTYDSKGNMLTKSDSHSKNMYTYDSNGNRLSHTFYQGGTVSNKIIYTYDSKGNMLTQIMYDSNDALIGKSVYIRDSEGKLVSIKSEGEPLI